MQKGSTTMTDPFGRETHRQISELARRTVMQGRGTKGWSKNLAGLAYAILSYAARFIEDEVSIVSIWGTFAELATHWELVKRRVRHRHHSVVSDLEFYASLLKMPGRTHLSAGTIEAELSYLTRIVWQDAHVGTGASAARIEFRVERLSEFKGLEFIVQYTPERASDKEASSPERVSVRLGGGGDWLSRDEKRDVAIHTEALLAALRRADASTTARNNLKDVIVSEFENQFDTLDKFRGFHPWLLNLADYARNNIVPAAAWEEARTGVLKSTELVNFCYAYGAVLGFHIDEFVRQKVEEFEEFSPEFREQVRNDQRQLMRTDLFEQAHVPTLKWIEPFIESWAAWSRTGVDIVHDLVVAARRYRQAMGGLFDPEKLREYMEADKEEAKRVRKVLTENEDGPEKF